LQENPFALGLITLRLPTPTPEHDSLPSALRRLLSHFSHKNITPAYLECHPGGKEPRTPQNPPKSKATSLKATENISQNEAKREGSVLIWGWCGALAVAMVKKWCGH